ncbi:MAG TPA: FecR domain-containing protein [Steroidobacteraceae bacterium]|jgi:transmembrane sensor
MAFIERPNSLRETAALWHAIAGQDTSAESLAALDAWLNESPGHRAAYRSIEQTRSILQSSAQDPRILEMRHEAARRAARSASATNRPVRWATAALIVLAVGAMLWVIASRAGFELTSLAWRNGESLSPATRSYATKTGDRLTVALVDGSQVTLNTETQIDVIFSKGSRAVRISRGEALFEVAKDPSRPFIVQSENRRFIAVGTKFDVRIDGPQVTVTMLEGTVRAEGAEVDSKLEATVTAGEQLVATAHAGDQIRRINTERETSWRHGQVIFENTRLSEAIDELNRYSTRHMALADPQLADLRISGTFNTGRTSAFIEAVTVYFPIEIGYADDHNVTLKARQ